MNYGELIAEVATRAEAEGLPTRAKQYVTQAETDLRQHFRPYEYPEINTISGGTNNWLLNEHQEIYIAAILKQYFLSKLDTEKAAAADGYMKTLIGDKKVADRVLRYSGEAQAVPGAHP